MSEKKSVQRNLFLELIRSALQDPECPEFDDNEKFIAFILKIVGSNNDIEFMFNLTAKEKCSKKSAELGSKGDFYFNSTENASLDKAIQKFTESIAYAPNGSQELAFGYAKRSLVLFESSLISDCVLDIDRALENNYPDKLKAKLYLLKASCLEILDTDNKAAIKNLKNKAREWSEKMHEKNQADMEVILDDENVIDKSIFSKWDWKKNLPKLERENPLIPGLSDAVGMQYSEKYGRHMVATRDIKPGEVLAVQEGYVKIVFPNSRYIFCWHCGEQMWASIPCENCVEVGFCSNICKINGQKEHHNIECPVIASLIPRGIFGTALLALRLLVKAYKEVDGCLETLEKNIKQIDDENNPRMRGFSNNIFDPKKFSSIYSLKGDSDITPFDREDDLCNAIFIAYSLATKSEFFGSKKEGKLITLAYDRKFIFVTGLLEKLRAIARINTFGISFPNLMGKVESSLGILSSSLSFFNHSCDPGSSRTDHGPFIANTAHRPIKKGEQIFISYGPTYKFLKKRKRHAYIRKNYRFICDCEACKNNWVRPKKEKTLSFEMSAHRKLRSVIEKISAKSFKYYNRLHSIGYSDYQNPDLALDIAETIEIIEECYRRGLKRNLFETSLAEQTLINYIDLTDDRYLSLDSFKD